MHTINDAKVGLEEARYLEKKRMRELTEKLNAGDKLRNHLIGEDKAKLDRQMAQLDGQLSTTAKMLSKSEHARAVHRAEIMNRK